MDQTGFCLTCWADMQFINAPICDVTGTPLPYGSGQDLLSIEALDHPPHYDKARIAVKFNLHSRKLIHKLKYQDQQHIAPIMAKMISHASRDLFADQPQESSICPIICPVPLYHWRYFKRRFNQADLLAKHIAKLNKSTYMPQLIKRIKATKTQVGLTRKQRQTNVKGAFKVNSKLIQKAKNRPIYIVDDVITTGATVDEIAISLKKVGLGPIYILAFAKVSKEKVI